jgi:transglutaminase-like putative cysteine protease
MEPTHSSVISPGRPDAASRPTVRAYVQAVLCAIGSAVTATLYGSFFAGDDYLSKLVAMSLGATAVAFATAAFTLNPHRAAYRRRTLITVGVCVAAFAVAAVYLVLPGTLSGAIPDLTTARVGARGLIGGWSSMLSIAMPAPVSAQLLMTPAAVTWVTAFLAVTAVLRSRSTLSPAAALVPAQVIGLLFVADYPGSHLPQTAALLAIAVTLVLIRADRSPRPRSRAPRRGLAGFVGVRALVVLVVVGAGVLGTSGVPWARGADRFDPRSLLDPALHLEPTISPLSEVRAQLERAQPEALFTVAVHAPPGTAIDRIPFATLDQYDGVQWTSSDAFLVAGPDLTPGPVLPGAVTVTEQVTISNLTGPFLPAVGRPTVIRAAFAGSARIGFATRSGDLVTDAPVLGGGSYTLTGLVRPVGPGIDHALSGTGADDTPYTALPPIPASIAALASNLAAQADGPYARLVVIANYLRQLPYSLNAAPGESYATLQAMLDATTAQGREGSSEQHAAAFAVLARDQGLPTRIAVGYLLRGGHQGTYTVTTADAAAWDQVYFQGYGWVDFDPTDPAKVPDSPPNNPRPRPVVTPPPRPQPSIGPAGSHREPATAQSGQGGGSPLRIAAWYIGAVVLAALMIAALATIAAKTALRRRRRRRGNCAQRTAGAWLETIDRLTEAGVHIPGSSTPAEIVEQVAAVGDDIRLGSRLRHAARLSLRDLSLLADRAVYAPDSLHDEDADQAWDLERDLCREIYRGRFIAHRVVHRLKPIRVVLRKRRARSRLRTGAAL